MNRTMRKLCYFLLTSILLTSFNPMITQAEDTSQKEIVRVGYYISPGFQNYDEETGEYSGSSYEYMIALKQYTNWKYEFVPVEFSTGVEMLQNGELDLMNNVSKTAEREETLGFSTYASGSNYGCLVVNADNTTISYNDFDTFDTMKVGMYETSIYNSYFESFCEEHNIHPEMIFYKTDAEVTHAMETGAIDGRIISNSYHDNCRVVAKFAPMDYYFAVPKGNTALLKELNIAMESVRTDMPDLEQDLQKRYSIRYVESSVIRSRSEEKYLEEHPTVTVAVSNAWYPISYFDEKGNYAGLLSNLYDRLSQETGITFNFVNYKDYNAALLGFRNHETDMISEFPYDFIYADQWNADLSDLVNDVNIYRVVDENTYHGEIKKIAIFGNTYLDEQVQKFYGDQIEYVRYQNATDAVNAVRDGSVDCTHLNYFQTGSFQNQGKYLSLNYVLVPSLEYSFCLGISKDSDPELHSLISKGLLTFTEADIESIFEKKVESVSTPDIVMVFYTNPWVIMISCSILAAIFVLVIGVIIYTRRMNKKNIELEKAKKSQTEFLARMSHDMRTPMNGILGLTSLMRDKNDIEEIRKDLDQLQFSGKYLLNLINDTLDMNKIESGKLELHLIPVDSEKLMNNILGNARIMSEDRGVTLKIELPSATPGNHLNVVTDGPRLEQILMNLISNAIKYTPVGGTVTISMEIMEVTEEEITKKYIIKDTGIGMSEEFLPHIFEPFSMEGRANTERQRGTGLGMSIVAKLVKLMNGEISVESKLNVGTEITLLMKYPIYHGVIQEEENHVDYTSILKGKHILMCEDHPLNAQIMEKLLEKVEINVKLADNGQVGVELFTASENEYYDAILMDVRMPVMDGLEATRQIRAINSKYARNIPIIAMTANAFDEDVHKCIQAGMNAHLSKPIERELLYSTLAKQITKSK